MTTQEVADNLVTWCREGNYQRCYEELYSPNIVSIEPEGGAFPRCEGMEAVQKKGQWWEETFEVHGGEVSDPIVADSWFTVKFDMDTTHKPSGHRVKSAELGVYRVQDGKIVSEQFFFDMAMP